MLRSVAEFWLVVFVIVCACVLWSPSPGHGFLVHREESGSEQPEVLTQEPMILKPLSTDDGYGHHDDEALDIINSLVPSGELDNPEFLHNYHNDEHKRVKKVLDDDEEKEVLTEIMDSKVDESPWAVHPRSRRSLPVETASETGNSTGLKFIFSSREIKMFQNVLQSTSLVLCSNLKKFPILMDKVEKSVQQRLRFAGYDLPKKRNSESSQVITSLANCTKIASVNASLSSSSEEKYPKRRANKYFDIEERQREEERMNILTQEDVVPNAFNSIAFEDALIHLVIKKCDHVSLLINSLGSTVNKLLKSDKYFNGDVMRKPSVHQNEMVQMVQAVIKCSR